MKVILRKKSPREKKREIKNPERAISLTFYSYDPKDT